MLGAFVMDIFLPRPKRRHGARLGPFGQRTAAAGAELRRAARRPAPHGLRRHGTGTITPAPARTRRHNGARAVLTIGHDDARGLPAPAALSPAPAGGRDADASVPRRRSCRASRAARRRRGTARPMSRPRRRLSSRTGCRSREDGTRAREARTRRCRRRSAPSRHSGRGRSRSTKLRPRCRISRRTRRAER